MGGSGGSGFSVSDPKSVADKLRSAEQTAQKEGFSSEVAQMLGDLLKQFNDRDTEKVQERIGELLGLLGDLVEGSVDTVFGGSVARHTYVDGLSDIDCLLTISDGDVGDRSPSDVLKDVAEIIREKLPGCNVSAGNLAVTVEYPDGTSIQLLPAVKGDNQLKVASWDGGHWSDINPEKFQQALTKANGFCSGKLVPTIKLVKAVNAGFPDDVRLSGYHIESLAINIFKGYQGEKTTAAMTEHFFQNAGAAVLSPVIDKSGQSVHVDENLGAEGSPVRVRISHLMDRVSKRIKNANARGSISTWQGLFADV